MNMESRTSTQTPPVKRTTPIEADSPITTRDLEDDDNSQDPDESVFQYEHQNGRTYHGYRKGSYLYPNDAPENDRLGLQHNLVKSRLSGQNHLAPLPMHKSIRILDIGTGTGIWAIEMGDAFPLAIIQGTDLSPIQPSDVPENVEFFIDDASEHSWGIPPASVDYIHTRILLGCFSSFADVLKRAYHYTTPGGYVESQELDPRPWCDDDSMSDDWPVLEWNRWLDQASLRADKPIRIAHKLKKWYEEAGFVDVEERVFKMPTHSWPRDRRLKKLGVGWQENLQASIGAVSVKPFTRYLSWSREETEVYLINVRQALANINVHAYQRIYVVWGRKPGEVKTSGGS